MKTPSVGLKHARRFLQIVEAVQAVADVVGVPNMQMISRGYHDSGLMAQITEVGMIFIPCRCAPRLTKKPSDQSQ